jgi:hypothetical protein
MPLTSLAASKGETALPASLFSSMRQELSRSNEGFRPQRIVGDDTMRLRDLGLKPTT